MMMGKSSYATPASAFRLHGTRSCREETVHEAIEQLNNIIQWFNHS
ncbi:hypothetical protein CIPAW_07G118700 [Carya illinoinensis]|uniref:Uncharacterized protein n=1 Tax=Carya illinoinensis TaxID=32201 RepID=A0A8T1PXX4_CARIL|nr:hypothetical protein CIPAW_07G118700 [Carya illinoinensis]